MVYTITLLHDQSGLNCPPLPRGFRYLESRDHRCPEHVVFHSACSIDQVRNMVIRLAHCDDRVARIRVLRDGLELPREGHVR